MRRIIGMLAVGLLLAGCEINIDLGASETIEGSGEQTEVTRALEDFDEVSFGVGGTLIIEQTGRPGLRIEGDANLMEHIATEVDGNTLTIKTEGKVKLDPDVPLRFYLSVDELEAIRVAGSGNVEVDGLDADDLTLSIAGAGDVELENLNADELEVEIAGAGDVVLSGKVDRQEISVAGTGDVEAEDLMSEEAEVNIAGAGSVRLHARDRLDVKIMGTGSVYYRGSPDITRQIMGMGSVEAID